MKRANNLLIAIAIGCTAMAQSPIEPYRNPALSAEERAADLLSRLTVDEKIDLMMNDSPAIERLGIPKYDWWNEALHGVGRAGVATVLPQSIGMAATFDDELIERAFDMVSTEARAKYNDFRRQGLNGRYQGLTFWTPNVNIFRDPRWGRGQETYGEDPYLASQMGRAVVRGLQGPASGRYLKTVAGAKHFAVHSGPEWNRHSFDAADIDPRDLWETYLPAFKALVEEGVGQVMCAYNRFEGEPCCSSKRLLQQILRQEWGYKGIVVTDCWALCDFYKPTYHCTHASGLEASVDAVVSGADLECGPVMGNLHEAYAKGMITEATIDGSVHKLLTARMRLGELDATDATPWAGLAPTVVDSRSHRELALNVARKSIVLLKNNGVLPLAKSGTAIAVMGPNAQDSVMQWGNYNGTPSHTVTILDGIRAKVGAGVAYLRGCDHVVNNNIVSHFGELSSDGQPGLSARYWNAQLPEGEPVATQRLTTPLNLSTGGATVFAPGVSLTDFSAIYAGTFTPSVSGTYIINLEADDGSQELWVDGELVVSSSTEGAVHHYSHSFYAEAGRDYSVRLHYGHGTGIAQLRFDIGKETAYDTDVSGAEVVVMVGGISPALEGEEMPVKLAGFKGGDRESIELPAVQRSLIKQLKAQGKRVVYVNCSGSAVALAPEDSICDAIVQAWYPGEEGGTAVADVLFGDYNPGGRLPVTFYRDDSQLPDYQDYDMDGRTYRYMTAAPLYPFGHGLSYTTFSYRGATLDRSEATVDDAGATLTVELSNDGERYGEEVVQVYVRRIGDNAGPVKTLRAYKRVGVAAGESVEVRLALGADAFQTFDVDSERMKVVAGDYEITCGGSSAQAAATLRITLR